MEDPQALFVSFKRSGSTLRETKIRLVPNCKLSEQKQNVSC